MSFGTNLQFLRKKNEMTQEALAERMDVSRQTISKWESDGAYPEMEKIIALCDMFSCTMDALLREDLTKEPTTSEADLAYDKHMNRFSFAIAGGVALVLFGICAMYVISAFFEIASVVIFFLFITAAVTIFILAGLSHDRFRKEHPHLGAIYDKETICHYDRRFPVFIAAPVAVILLDVAFLIGLFALPVPQGMAKGAWETIIMAIFFLVLTVAVPVLVWAGIQKSKYDIEEYNKEIEKEQNGTESLAGKISSVIMILATIVFLLLGFGWELWHPAWVAFPVGGLLCGVVSVLVPEKK